VTAAPLATTPVAALDFSARLTPETARRSVFVAELWQGGACLSRQVLPCVPDKHLELGEPNFNLSLEQVGVELEITLKTLSLARFVALELEGAQGVVFSDNYFDLPVGRTAHLTCPLPAGWSLAQARQALHVRSLKESY
jgi:beta-mannosidase